MPRALPHRATVVRAEYPTATAKDVLTIVKKSFGLLRHGKANDWLDSALRSDGAITIASPSHVEASFLEAMGFYMTPDAALDLLKELGKRTSLSLVQVCEEYKRLLAVYVGVSKKELTDERLLAENNFKYLSNALGPPVNLLVHKWRTSKSFHEIQETLAHGERRGDSAFTRPTARRGIVANIDEPDGAETSVLEGLVNSIAQLSASVHEQGQQTATALSSWAAGRGRGGHNGSTGRGDRKRRSARAPCGSTSNTDQ